MGVINFVFQELSLCTEAQAHQPFQQRQHRLTPTHVDGMFNLSDDSANFESIWKLSAWFSKTLPYKALSSLYVSWSLLSLQNGVHAEQNVSFMFVTGLALSL